MFPEKTNDSRPGGDKRARLEKWGKRNRWGKLPGFSAGLGPLHFLAEGLAVDAQDTGRPGLIAFYAAKDIGDMFRFDLRQGAIETLLPVDLKSHTFRQVGDIDHITFNQDDEALDEVFQLPDIALPAI